MTQWFGESWGAPICRECPHVSTPVGQRCGSCNAPIEADDQGVLLPHLGALNDVQYRALPYHLDCFLDGILPSHAGRIQRR